MFGECELWGSIKDGKYSWLKIKSHKKKKLFRLIDSGAPAREARQRSTTGNKIW